MAGEDEHDRKPRNAELEAHLLKQGVSPETAAWLAAHTEADTEGAAGDVEATTVARPALAAKYGSKLAAGKAGRVEVVLPATKPPKPR